MEWEEKLDFILDYLKIKNKTVADEFKVSNGAVSQWRNKKAKKLNRVHILAFEKAFDIPTFIFENSSINTKEQIVEILDNRQFNSFKNDTTNALVGSWYFYFYKNKITTEAVLEIKNNNVVYLYIDNRLYQGYFLTLSSNESIVTLESQESSESFLIIINKKELNSRLFFTSLYYTNSSETLFEYALLSSSKIDLYLAKYLLSNHLKNGSVLTLDMKDRLSEYLKKPQIIKSSAEYIKTLLGEWYLYFDADKFFKLIIKEDDRVEWYYKNKFIKGGYLIVDEDTVKIVFKRAFRKSYLLFAKRSNPIKIACYKGYEPITYDNILRVTLLSKELLLKEEINRILKDECKTINVDSFRRELFHFINEKKELVK